MIRAISIIPATGYEGGRQPAVIIMVTRFLRKGVITRALPAAFALAVAIAAGLAFWQVSQPLKAPLFYPLSESYYTRAVDAPTPAEKIRWAQSALNVAPYRAENWLLMAYAYQSQDIALSERVLSALRQSYVIAPFAPDATEWRLAYVYSNWTQMPPDLRSLANAEATAYVTRTVGHTYLSNLAPSLRDKAGSFALSSVVMAYESQMQLRKLQDNRF